jgi:hypothetical protein
MKKVLVNSVFVGGYGHNKGNLPHEMINFFKEDNDRYYIYVTPYGVIDPNLAEEKLDSVLFVKSVGDGLVEVLARADFDENSELFTKGIRLIGKNPDESIVHGIKSKKKQKEYQDKLKEEKITYGHVSLNDIHSANIRDNEILVTARVTGIALPKNTFYLTLERKPDQFGDNVYDIGLNKPDAKKIANQSMKFYLDLKETEEDSLRKIVDRSDPLNLWKPYVQTPSYSSNRCKIKNNFFRVTRQQDNEVMFSNMFYYMFSEYSDLLTTFSKEVLNIELEGKPLVEREKDRMDIRIIDDKHFIIIENKIKSSINGLKFIKGSKKEYQKDEKGKYISQLSVYYEKARKHISELTEENMEIYGFILTPNYNKIDTNLYSYGDKYIVKQYSLIHEFLKEYIKDKNNEGANDQYILDFVTAMEKHTDKTDNQFRKELMDRLATRIESFDQK